MKQIRTGVFETNSSSTHAICISKDTDKSKITLPKKVLVCAGEFGWGFDKFNDLENKISYLITAIQYMDDPQMYESKLEAFLDNLEIEHGLDRVTCLSGNWYIDHQSIDTAQELVEELFDNEDLLFNYLFDDDSVLLIGNDNNDTIYEELYSDYEDSYGWNHEELNDRYKNMEVIK